MALSDDKQAERVNKELNKYQALDDADIDAFIASMLEDPKGKRFLWWLLQIGKFGTQPFTPDPYATAFQCGELNIGQQVLARVTEVNPLGFAQLQLQRKDEDDRRNAAASAIARGDDLYAPGDDYT